MNARSLQLDGASAGVLCVLRWPPLDGVSGRVPHLAWPLLQRPGAFLAAVPASLQVEAADLASSDDATVIGPSTLVVAPAVEEGDTGEDVPTGLEMSVLLVDLEESVLRFMSVFDPVTESGTVTCFEPESPHLLPSPEDLMRLAAQWVGADGSSGLPYLSAQEEVDPLPSAGPKAAPKGKRITTAQLAEQVNQLAAVLPGIMDQIKVLAERQAAAPNQSTPQPLPVPTAPVPAPAHQQNFPALVNNPAPQPCLASLASALPVPARPAAASAVPGPAPAPAQPALAQPCSASATSSDQLATAIAQQGQALSLLVSHLASQGDAVDLSSASAGLSTKGSAKRERLQQELMQRSGSFFLQVCQNAFRRLHPAAQVPASVPDLASDGRLSFVTYMERFGGYNKSRDLALVMHQACFIADCLIRDDVPGAREHLALLLASVEQAAQDQSWSLAYLLTLLEEPAPQVYAPRPQGHASRLRAFSPLVSPSWGSTTLAFVREIDLLTQRRKDAAGPRGQTEQADETVAQPKRRPRFPKKPKETGQ